MRRGGIFRRAPTAPTFTLSHAGASFQLQVVEEARLAQRLYARWADGVEVFELVMLECVTRLLQQVERPVFMDVGAFMGHYACFASALLGDREEVYAIESNPAYHAAIARSIELNGFSRLRPFNVVLSDRTEEAAIDDQAVRLFDATGEATRTAITLDELCRRERLEPVIVKVDVHGSEGKVLMGMRETLARSVRYLLLELHPKEVVREYSGQIGWDDILGLLWSLGFHVFHVAGHRYRARAELRRSLEDGFAYRRVDERTAELLLFDRPLDVFLLCTRDPAIEGVLGPSIIDPGLAPHDW